MCPVSNARFAAALGIAAALTGVAAEAREMSTDRPDKTESPYTVPKGSWQLEMDAVNWTRDKEDGVTTKSVSVAPFNLKYGVGANSDLQLVVAPYTDVEVRGGGANTDASGFGDVIIRLKHNFWGNDGGPSAFGLMPFVKLPTASDEFGANNDVEGGLIAPLALDLGDGFGLGVMGQVNVLKDSKDDYAPEFVVSATLGHDLTDRLGGYVELWASRFDDTGEKTQATFDTGLTYAVTQTLQLDTGVNIGLNNATDDVQAFVGVSRRW